MQTKKESHDSLFKACRSFWLDYQTKVYCFSDLRPYVHRLDKEDRDNFIASMGDTAAVSIDNYADVESELSEMEASTIAKMDALKIDDDEEEEPSKKEDEEASAENKENSDEQSKDQDSVSAF